MGNSVSRRRSAVGYRSQSKGQVSELQRELHTESPKLGISLMSFRTSKRVRVSGEGSNEDTGRNEITEAGYRQDHSGPEGHAREIGLFSRCDRKSLVGLAQVTQYDDHFLKDLSSCSVKNSWGEGGIGSKNSRGGKRLLEAGIGETFCNML